MRLKLVLWHEQKCWTIYFEAALCLKPVVLYPVFGRTPSVASCSVSEACAVATSAGPLYPERVMWCQVFGRTMVCKDMEVALKVAHRDNLDGITMEGTQVSKKGVLKGGFYDVSRSVMGTPFVIIQTQRSMNAVISTLTDSVSCLVGSVPSSVLGVCLFTPVPNSALRFPEGALGDFDCTSLLLPPALAYLNIFQMTWAHIENNPLVD